MPDQKRFILEIANDLPVEVITRILIYIRYFDRTMNGEYVFPPEQQLNIALQSLSHSDTILADRYYCDRRVIERGRKQLNAILAYLFPEKFTNSELDNTALGYLNHLRLIPQTTFIENARLLLEKRSFAPALRMFFESYILELTIIKLFNDLGIDLDRSTRFNYDHAVRAFLNPDISKKEGFRNVLTRYIFLRLFLGIDDIFTVLGHLGNAAQLNVTKSSSEYLALNAIKGFLKLPRPHLELGNLSEHIGIKDLPIKDLGQKYNYVANFIFNLYLASRPMSRDSHSYLHLLNAKPRDELDKLRSLLPIDTKLSET